MILHNTTNPADVPVIDNAPHEERDRLCEVTLHNDDMNDMDHVMRSLMKVFGHSIHLAAKIMGEAHVNGRAIAEVESLQQAQRHRDQLQSLGLIATVSEI